MNKTTYSLIFFILISMIPTNAQSFGGGYASIPYLVKILTENYRRYQQLKMMIDQAKNSKEYLKNLHDGLESITGLVKDLPINDHGILKDLTSFQKSLKTISDVYGQIPKSPEQRLHQLHDQTIAESLKMINGFKDYSKVQDNNSDTLRIQSESASPKGAARATAVSNALILKSINQLIRLQSQSLKMQSEKFALINKGQKDSVSSYQNVNQSLGKAFGNIRKSKGLISF